MRLGVNLRFTRLIFVFIGLFFSAFSYAAYYPYFYDISSIKKNNQSAESQGFDFSKCSNFLGNATEKEGNPGAKQDDVVVEQGKNYLTIAIGTRGNYFAADGRFEYEETHYFNVPSAFQPTLLSAFKKSLSSGNCSLANALANQLANGEPKQCGDDQCIGFEDDNGSICAISSNGSSKCKWDGGTANGTNEDGTPKITISPREGTLEDYAGVNETDVVGHDNPNNSDNPPNPGESDNPGNTGSNSGTGNNNGQGSSNSGGTSNSGTGTGGGTGTTEGNTSGSMGDGSAGSGNGSGGTGTGGNGTGSQGEGQGSGGEGQGSGGKIGDGNSDEDKKEGKPLDLSAPSMKEAFSGLKKALKDKFLGDFEIKGGECPKPSVTILSRTYHIRQHCDILETVQEYFSALMMFLYTFAAMRVILSA